MQDVGVVVERAADRRPPPSLPARHLARKVARGVHGPFERREPEHLPVEAASDGRPCLAVPLRNVARRHAARLGEVAASEEHVGDSTTGGQCGTDDDERKRRSHHLKTRTRDGTRNRNRKPEAQGAGPVT